MLGGVSKVRSMQEFIAFTQNPNSFLEKMSQGLLL